MNVTMRSKECRRCHEAVALMVGGILPETMTAELKAHLATCNDCQRHVEEVRALGENLRRLAAAPVEPSAGFEQRWRAAIHNTPQRAGFAEWLVQLLRRNRRPLLAFAPVWVLILVFRFTAPEVAPAQAVASARSPVEIARALKASTSLAGTFDSRFDASEPPKSLPRPRSEMLPCDPAMQRRWVKGPRLERVVS